MKLSVSGKLWFLAGISLAGIAVLVTLSRVQMVRVYTSASYANDNTVPSLLVLRDAADNFDEQRVRFWQRLIETDPARSAQLERDLQRARRAIYDALQAYEPLLSDDKDRGLLAADRAALHAVDELFDRALTLAQADKRNDARDLVMQNRAVIDSALAAFTAHHEYNKQLGQKGSLEAQQIEGTAMLIGLVSGVIVVG